MNTVKNTVKFEGKNFVLTQRPHISDSGETYEALGCLAGEEVIVFWDVCEFVDGQPDEEDEMCDWESPSRVVFI